MSESVATTTPTPTPTETNYVNFLKENDVIRFRRLDAGTLLPFVSLLQQQFHLPVKETTTKQRDDNKNERKRNDEESFSVQPNIANDHCYSIFFNNQSRLPDNVFLCVLYTETKGVFHIGMRTRDELLLLRENETFSATTTQPLLSVRLEIVTDTDAEGDGVESEMNANKKKALPVLRADKTATTGTTSGHTNDTVVIVFVVIVSLIVVSGLSYIGYIMWNYMKPNPVHEIAKRMISNENVKERDSSSMNAEKLQVEQGEGTIG